MTTTSGQRRRFRPGRRASYREGASFGALTFALATLTSVVSSIACSRIYGIDVIGEYALAVGAVSIVRLLSTAKERPALVRELTKSEPGAPRVTGLFAATFTFSLALTLVVGVGAVLVSRLLLSGPISRPSLFLPLAANVLGYVLLGNTCENLDVVSSSFRAGRQLFWVRMGDAVSFVAVAVILAGTASVWGLVLASCASQGLGLLHRLIRIRGYLRFRATRQVLRDGFKTVPGLIRFGLKIAPGALADGASNESGTWLVATFSPIASVGAYGRAYLVIKQLMVINLYTNEMLFPTLVERRARNDGPGYARALVDSLRYSTMSMLLLFAAAGGVATGIMHVFGAGFDRGSDALVVLLLVPALMLFSQIQRFALYSLERPWLASLSGFLRFIVTISAGAILTWKFGAVGAAVALVAGFVVDVTFVTGLVVRHLVVPMRKLWTPVEWASLAFASMAGFSAARAIYDLLEYPFGIFAGSIAGGLIFVAALALTGALNERDVARLRDIRKMAANRRDRTAQPADEAMATPRLAVATATAGLRAAAPGVRSASQGPTADSLTARAANGSGAKGQRLQSAPGDDMTKRRPLSRAGARVAFAGAVAVAVIALILVLSSGGGHNKPVTKPTISIKPHRGRCSLGVGCPSFSPRFFAANSIWNAPVPANAPLDPNSAAVVGNLVAQEQAETVNVATSSYGVPMYTVGPKQPTVRVALDGTVVSPILQQVFDAVPLPSDAQPAAGTDGNLAVYQPSTDTMWEFWRMVRGPSGWTAAFGGRMIRVSTDPGYYQNVVSPTGTVLEKASWGAPASSLPLVGGVMTISELQSGQINHALALGIGQARARAWAWPAQRTDGRSFAANAPPEGAHFRLDPNLNLKSLHLPHFVQMMAVAAQKYGIVINNSSHGFTFRAEDPTQFEAIRHYDPYKGPDELPGTPGALLSEWPSVMLRLFPWGHLQLLKMDVRTRPDTAHVVESPAG